MYSKCRHCDRMAQPGVGSLASVIPTPRKNYSPNTDLPESTRDREIMG